MYKTFQLTTDDEEIYEFNISDSSGTLYISVPDQGGQMDSVPKNPNALEWLECTLKDFHEATQVWPTCFEIESLEACEKICLILTEAGAVMTQSG